MRIFFKDMNLNVFSSAPANTELCRGQHKLIHYRYQTVWHTNQSSQGKEELSSVTSTAA